MSRSLKETARVRLLDEARALSGDFDKLSQAVAERVGMSQVELLAMDLISRAGRMTAGQLARELNLTTGAITGLIDRLEKAGYARRVADPDDRRRVFVTATARERRVRDLYAPLNSSLRAAISGYSEPQLAMLAEFLGGLRRAVGDSADKMTRVPPGRRRS